MEDYLTVFVGTGVELGHFTDQLRIGLLQHLVLGFELGVGISDIHVLHPGFMHLLFRFLEFFSYCLVCDPELLAFASLLFKQGQRLQILLFETLFAVFFCTESGL